MNPVQIMRARFGGAERTLTDISAEWGVSRERVRQIEARAFCKIRHGHCLHVALDGLQRALGALLEAEKEGRSQRELRRCFGATVEALRTVEAVESMMDQAHIDAVFAARRRAARAVAAVAIVFATLFGAARSSAQAQPYAPEVVDLARVCVSEVGWRVDVGDCPAIHAVLTARAERRGSTFAAQARSYSSRVFDRRRTDRRRWIAWLSPTFELPRGWPSSALSWARGAELWRARLEEAAAIVRGEKGHGCARTPHHWGARYGIDLERAERAIRAGRWVRAECPGTLNRFYAVRGW